MSFEIKKSQSDGKTVFSFFGQIDEEAKFPVVSDVSGEVVIDLDGVKAINSVGIRTWLQWFKSFGDCHYTFLKCPKSVVMQMNMVEGFLPDNSYVQSFYVPYYCESCDEEIAQLFNVGQEITVGNGGFNITFDSTKICSDGTAAELDANETKYFKFLLKMSVKQAA